MNRTIDSGRLTASALAVALILPAAAGAQQHQHHHDHAAADRGHHHASGPVDCRTLAGPPWAGLPDRDRESIRRIEAAVAHLVSPEAAARAGFTPRLGDIPTMGVHWVNPARMRAGFRLEEPDHVMFSRVDGEDRLVGIAFAFRGPHDMTIPDAFGSELAAWHDHPALGGPGATLHMLHVWFVPSPYGPFAGNNFFLPFLARGIRPPDACWLGTEQDVERFELVATTLALFGRLAGGDDARPGFDRLIRARAGVSREQLRRSAERFDGWAVALDLAVAGGEREVWNDVADRMLSALGPVEHRWVEALRSAVKGAQLSSAARGR